MLEFEFGDRVVEVPDKLGISFLAYESFLDEGLSPAQHSFFDHPIRDLNQPIGVKFGQLFFWDAEFRHQQLTKHHPALQKLNPCQIGVIDAVGLALRPSVEQFLVVPLLDRILPVDIQKLLQLISLLHNLKQIMLRVESKRRYLLPFGGEMHDGFLEVMESKVIIFLAQDTQDSLLILAFGIVELYLLEDLGFLFWFVALQGHSQDLLLVH